MICTLTGMVLTISGYWCNIRFIQKQNCFQSLLSSLKKNRCGQLMTTKVFLKQQHKCLFVSYMNMSKSALV